MDGPTPPELRTSPIFFDAVLYPHRSLPPQGFIVLMLVLSVVSFAAGVEQTTRVLLSDAQTSGGLLIAVAPDRVGGLVAALQRAGTPAAAVIGKVVPGTPGRIAVS